MSEPLPTLAKLSLGDKPPNFGISDAAYESMEAHVIEAPRIITTRAIGLSADEIAEQTAQALERAIVMSITHSREGTPDA